MIDITHLSSGVPSQAQWKIMSATPGEELKNLGKKDSPELREAFDDFVGQTFFGQLMKQMRETVDKPAYFHGGMGEDVFQSQLDQLLVERISDASAENFSQPMYERFMLGRG